MQVIFDTKIKDFINSCQRPTHAKIDRYTDMLAKYGPLLTMPFARQLSHNLYELRIRGRQEIRIFYCFHLGKVILVHAFIKKAQKTPQREIDTARQRIKYLTA